MGIYTVATALLALTSGISGFSVEVSRRQAIQAAIGGVITVAAPSLVSVFPANAVPDEETPRIVTRQGGLLVRSKLPRILGFFIFIIYTVSSSLALQRRRINASYIGCDI
jgi:hypothetical protein